MQKGDLARMYRLFQRIPKGLEPVAESFKKHVESEGMKLVKEATEAASAKKDKDAGKPTKDSGMSVAEYGARLLLVMLSSYDHAFTSVKHGSADMAQ